MVNDQAQLLVAKNVLLGTRKRDGSWVSTPVSLVTESGHTYFRTYDAAGKAKRLRNFPDVTVTACSLRGKAHGPTHQGRARLLTGAEAETARSALAHHFPFLHRYLVPWMHRRKGWTTLHYELALDS